MSLGQVFSEFLAPYVPRQHIKRNLPFVTLTYAASIDSCIASAPNTRTAISHEETKQMTQYLRSVHNGILIGCGTAIADDPGLNYKETLSQSPRPVIIDPNLRWQVCASSKIIKLARDNEGRGPWIVCREGLRNRYPERLKLLRSVGGDILELPGHRFEWEALFQLLHRQGLESIMVEGGASIINQLLAHSQFVDALVVTIAPVFFGDGGVRVTPAKSASLANVKWWQGTRDVVLAAKMAAA